MRFSLVLATKNRVKELESFLQSLAAQSYDNFELILVDQNTDDRLVGLVNVYGQRFPILHIKQPQLGLSRVRNQGLRHIQGDIVGFPDDDCIYPPNVLAEIADFFERDETWGGLIVNVLDLEEDKEAMLFRPEKAGSVDYTKGWTVGMTAALFFRRHFAQKIQFDENIGPGTPWGATEDIDYLYSCLDNGAKVYYDPEITIRHPTPSKIYTIPQLIQREYNHGRGAGFLMGKRNFPLSRVIWLMTNPLIFFIPALLQGQGRKATYFPGISLGRLQGYLGNLKERRKTRL